MSILSKTVEKKQKLNSNRKKISELKNVSPVNQHAKVIASSNLDNNINVIQTVLENCDDIVHRKFSLGLKSDIHMYVMYTDSMINKESLEESILKEILRRLENKSKADFENDEEIYSYIKNNCIAINDIKEDNDLDKAIMSVSSGDVVILMDGCKKFLIIQLRRWASRGIPKPETEVELKGSREGFTESLRMNTVLIRRRIKDSNLKVKEMSVGRRTKTTVAVMYIEGIARQSVIDKMIRKIESIDIDGIFDTSYIEAFFVKKKYWLLPITQTTERPDKVASSLLGGRIAVIVDNTPFVLIAPATLNNFFQTSDDYYQNNIVASFTRIMRYVAAYVTITVAGMYIALSTFHSEMIPTQLLLVLAKARSGVPFPAFLEILIMEVMFEFLREGGIRLPRPIGSTVGIVGRRYTWRGCR